MKMLLLLLPLLGAVSSYADVCLNPMGAGIVQQATVRYETVCAESITITKNETFVVRPYHYLDYPFSDVPEADANGFIKLRIRAKENLNEVCTYLLRNGDAVKGTEKFETVTARYLILSENGIKPSKLKRTQFLKELKCSRNY